MTLRLPQTALRTIAALGLTWIAVNALWLSTLAPAFG